MSDHRQRSSSSADGVVVALVGAGHGHSNLYLPPLLQNPNVRSVVLTDPNEAALSQLTAKYGAETRESVDQLLQDFEPALFIVLGHHCQMAEQAIRLLEHRKPIILEKPGGISLEEVEAVREAAAIAGAPIFVPFVQRIGELPALMDEVGLIRHATFQFFGGPPQRYRDLGMEWILDRETAGAGVLFNLAVHFIDLFLWKSRGDVARVQGSLHRYDPSITVDDLARVLITTTEGVSGFVETGYSTGDAHQRHVAFAFGGELGLSTVDSIGSFSIMRADGTETGRAAVNSDDYYARWTTELIDAIVAGAHPGAEIATIEDLVVVHRVIDALLHSQY